MERGGPTARNHIALQSYRKIAMFWPKQILANFNPPVMMLLPELNLISPPELQQEMFDKLKSPVKKVLWVKDKGHLNLLGGEGKDYLWKEQLGFICEALEMNVEIMVLEL
ncbi:DltD domain-containing protein [Diaporthe helianthi]|uniref:DltD domain-containing protein n=1 Tax=Diaporthe helianthi TaxID=158607 RepID=A0A2P5HUH7_DIAHE|nr:DltD domain-containing protein [Diaporthe helianthi]